jgi:P2 family phage major capsid protein
MSHILSTQGRHRAAEFMAALAAFHGVPSASSVFSVDPARAQELLPLIEEDGVPFLGMVSLLPKTEMKGDVIYFGNSILSAARTDTAGGDMRTPKAVHGLTKNVYDMSPVENDVKLDYAQIDSWAMFPNFYDLWGQTVRRAIARDRLRVGWNGESAAVSTNGTTNPNGEDVLPGWLELIRTNEDYYVAGTVVAGQTTTHEVILGSEDFPNLDYLVATVKARIHPVFRSSPDLVAVISQDLVSYEEQQFLKENGRKALDKATISANGQLVRTFGMMPAYCPPFLPDGVVLVTELKNLHLYFQPTSVRRKVEDMPAANAFVDWNSRNEAYAVGDYRAASLVDGITLYVAPEEPPAGP